VLAVVHWVQLDLLAPAWLNRVEGEAPDDDPFVSAPIVHRVVLALEAEPPQTTGIRSVFDLPAVVLSKPPGPEKPEPAAQPRYGRTVRELGVTRHIAMRHDETEEWQERERARRARQRVPRPSRKARTRGKKLLDLIGQEAATA
jgi:predicted component of type VI protein secretion system